MVLEVLEIPGVMVIHEVLEILEVLELSYWKKNCRKRDRSSFTKDL